MITDDKENALNKVFRRLEGRVKSALEVLYEDDTTMVQAKKFVTDYIWTAYRDVLNIEEDDDE